MAKQLHGMCVSFRELLFAFDTLVFIFAEKTALV